MTWMEEFTKTEMDPGEEVRIGTDPRKGEGVFAFVRAIPYREHERIERENKGGPGVDFETLPLVNRQAIVFAKAKLALADGGTNFVVRPGDAAQAARLRTVFADETINEGVDVAIAGRCTDVVKDWLFKESSKGQWLVNRILECEREIRNRSMVREEKLAKN